MSTSFSVFPSNKKAPVVGDFLALTEDVFHQRCQEAGVEERPKLSLFLNHKDKESRTSFTTSDFMEWSTHEYAWLSIDGVEGGTSIYYRENNELDVLCWRDAIGSRPKNLRAHDLENCLIPGFHWRLRRSAGQSGSINILYGLAAGCLADVTSGAAYSDDGAWDHDHLPMLGTQLLDEYMRPWKTTNPAFSNWAQRSLEGLKSDFR